MTEEFEPDEDKLEDLDPELTDKLARALDRFQMAQAYQPLVGRGNRQPSTAGLQTKSETENKLTAEQKAAYEAKLTQELKALLITAASLNQVFGAARLKAAPDAHYRQNLKEELGQAARLKKPSPDNPA